MKYKIGDKVRVRKDLEIGCDYGNDVFAEGMESFIGKIATITNINARNEYIIDVDNGFWGWTDEMLEPVSLYKVGDKVLIKDLTEACEDDYSFGIVDEMKDLSNKVCTIKSVYLDPDVKDDEEISYDGYEYMLEEDYGEYTWSSDMFVGSVIKASSNSTAISQDDPGPRGDIGVLTTTAEAIAQAVDNVKGPQFKIGDKVIIRNDLVLGKEYNEWDYSPEDGLGGWIFLPEMAEYKGKVATVTGFGDMEDVNYLRLDIDGGRYSWIINAVSHYTPGSDYDLDKQIINQLTNNKHYENQLQGKEEPLIGGCECTGTGVCYPGEQVATCIGHLGYRKITYRS